MINDELGDKLCDAIGDVLRTHPLDGIDLSTDNTLMRHLCDIDIWVNAQRVSVGTRGGRDTNIRRRFRDYQRAGVIDFRDVESL